MPTKKNDLDSYFHHLEKNGSFNLPVDRLGSTLQTCQLLLTATEKTSCDSVYLEPDSSSVIQCMKASSAVPLLYRDEVTIDGQVLIDGSVADPVPVVKAYAVGATDIVVIHTLSKDTDNTGWRRQWRS